MIILRNKGYDWLFTQLSEYNSFSDNGKRKILYISIKNLMYILPKEQIEKIRHGLDKILDLSYKISDIRKYFECILNATYDVKKIGAFSDLELCCNKLYGVLKGIDDCIDEVKVSKTDNMPKRRFLTFNNAVELNLNLAESGICPLIMYAFDEWQLNDKKNLSQVMELSLMYLYRYECNNCMAPKGYKLFNSNGATCNIYVNYSNNRICKVAKNFAASKYLMEQEYKNISDLAQTELNSFLPRHYEYDKECSRLSHDNVIGDCAEKLLVQRRINQDAINQLGIFYDTYMSRINKDLILDIHPGNFVWDEGKKMWCLVDCGAIAKIGCEYYEYTTFEEYFKKVWIDRVYNIVKYPIRSMDLSINNILKKNYGVKG